MSRAREAGCLRRRYLGKDESNKPAKQKGGAQKGKAAGAKAIAALAGWFFSRAVGLAAHAGAVGVKQRFGDQPGLMHVAKDFDLNLQSGLGHWCGDKAQGDGFLAVVGIAA